LGELFLFDFLFQLTNMGIRNSQQIKKMKTHIVLFETPYVLLIEDSSGRHFVRFEVRHGHYNELEWLIEENVLSWKHTPTLGSLNISSSTFIDALIVLNEILNRSKRQFHSERFDLELTRESLSGPVASFSLRDGDRVVHTGDGIIVNIGLESFLSSMEKTFSYRHQINPYYREDLASILSIYESLKERFGKKSVVSV
jgi:hypothetical protein